MAGAPTANAAARAPKAGAVAWTPIADAVGEGLAADAVSTFRFFSGGGRPLRALTKAAQNASGSIGLAIAQVCVE